MRLPDIFKKDQDMVKIHNSMNRIDRLFAEEKKILSIYCTAGYPRLNDTLAVMQALQENGADMLELGIPYSDPLADGPVIQQSSQAAIGNGMNLQLLFEQLKDMRSTIRIPVILMGYLNPVLQFGMERFCREAAAAGIDGVILPDLPFYEYERDFRRHFNKYGLHVIFLVTPETGEDRIRCIDEASRGFLYAVSASAITGGAKTISGQGAYFQKLGSMKLKNPVLVGFGINNKSDLDLACRYTRGAIIGSAYIRAISKGGEIRAITKEFINELTGRAGS